MGQEPFAYFGLGRHSGFSKVSRCKSGTLSGRYRRNGYVLGLIQHPGRLSGRHRGQASSHSRAELILIGQASLTTMVARRRPTAYGFFTPTRLINPANGKSPSNSARLAVCIGCG